MEREMKVPVGGTFRYGYFVGITARGLWQYNSMPGRQIASPRTPTPFELIAPEFQAKNNTQSKKIVALFHHRADADDCFIELKKNKAESFDSRWWSETKNVLLGIGCEHPLISISTSKKFAVPEYLYNPNTPFPEVVTH